MYAFTEEEKITLHNQIGDIYKTYIQDAEEPLRKIKVLKYKKFHRFCKNKMYLSRLKEARSISHKFDLKLLLSCF